MSKAATKEDFKIFTRSISRRFNHVDKQLGGLGSSISELRTKFVGLEVSLGDRMGGLREELKNEIRSAITHFNKSQGVQNRHLDQMDAKLEAITEMLATRHEVRNLVRELKLQKIRLDESKIFTT